VREVLINDRWPLLLPDHRADRHSWSWWEATRLACMYHYLGTGGYTIWDIGAEEGDFPALWSSWGNDVVLVEPNKKVWPNIKAIWDANELSPPVATFAGFIGGVGWPEPEITVGGWPHYADGPVISDHGFLNLCERPDVQRITADSLASEIGPPSALTIDVEGAECEVLFSAGRVLKEHRPLVWVSVHPDFMRDMYRDTPERLDEWMATLGYEKTPLCTDHEQHVFYWPKERELFVQ
jgi:FkbM family methyltransferase